MIILDATTKSLQFKLSGAVTANQLPFIASYIDSTGTATTPGEQDGASNNTTAVTVVSPPASSTQRLVKNIVIQNADTATATVTVIYNNNSTLRNIFVATMAVGDQLIYEDGNGWFTIDNNGNLKTSGSGGGSGTVTSVSVVSGNGLAGTVANATTTPAITLSTSVSGILKGNGTAISGATGDVDYQNPITLTTTGTSGAATFSGDTLNIPQYGSGSGTVTSVSVVSANGLAGSVANATTTPAITLSTSINGMLKGNGTAISAATGDVDYQNPITLTTTGSSGPATFSADTLNIPQYGGGGSGITTLSVQKFTSSGTYTPSTGMLYCIVEAVGGGGGGGGVKNINATPQSGGGGGGGGSYSRTILSAATVGASQTVTVGTGGSGGSTSGGNGSAGNDSSLGTLCIGKAGSGGGGAMSGGSGTSGAGGVAGTGDITVVGGNGGAGLGGTITTFFGSSGFGGSSCLGGGAQSITGAGSTSAAGNTGVNYGSGGSGASALGSVTGSAGGSGAAGIVVVTEFCS